jgi:hypothetical protein
MLRRENDSLRLFRPLDTQVPAITTRASEVVVRGGNRSGKSVLGAAIVASAARQKPLFDLSGKQLPHFSPTGRPLLIWVIGKGEDHIGDTIYRLLFKPGQFPVYFDPTGKLRAARTYEEKVLGESQKDANGRRPVAPAFIPESEWQGRPSYTKAAADVFDRVTLQNGTVICAYNSSGEVKMGDPVDLIWIDEDIIWPEYVSEWQARLSDRKGRLLWTAWPWASNFALRRLSDRAEKQKGNKSPDVFELRLSFADNPFIDKDEKRKRIEGWSEAGDSEVRSRVEGEWADEGSLMYPSFTPALHGIPLEGRDEDDKLTAVLRPRGWNPPSHWTRYLILDPGHSYAAMGFWAVPPPDEFNGVKVLYDELYLSGYSAPEVAARVLKKIEAENLQFEEMIIDFSYARQHASGTGKTFLQIYSDAFTDAGIRPRRGQMGFTFSSNDVAAGIESVRGWLGCRGDGTATFRIVQANCPNWIRECQMYRKHIQKNEAQDKPAAGQRDHLMDMTRYAAQHGLQWVAPEVPVATAGNQYEHFRNLWKKDSGEGEPASFTIGVGTKS